MTEKRFPRCPDCGGRVKLLATPGRTREYLRGVHLAIPSDFELPTCTRCSEPSMSPEYSQPLDEILEGRLTVADIRERWPELWAWVTCQQGDGRVVTGHQDGWRSRHFVRSRDDDALQKKARAQLLQALGVEEE